MVRNISGFALAPFLLLGGCALQPTYQRPALDIPVSWNSGGAEPSRHASASGENWWSRLEDPAIDRLVTASLSGNPTLEEAAARVDQARAALVVRDSRKLPGVDVEGSVARSAKLAGSGSGASGETSASIGGRISWELDLWGRVRESSTAARNRLTARAADAEAARLSVTGDIADTVLALRACNLTLEIRDRDIASRETELEISRARLAFGHIAPVAVAAAESNLANARTARIGQEESCRRLVNALAALSGVQPVEIRDLSSQDLRRAVGAGGDRSDSAMPLPEPPPFAPALPATVLLRHPAVVATEREAAARWSEIAMARAERLPRIDLVSALTGQWIHLLGSGTSHVSGSAGANLGGPLLDHGAGAANVHAAEAAYREAVAQLGAAVRAAVRDVEDGLAAQQSAEARIQTAAAAVEAARSTLATHEARWRSGAIAQFELEEARRQFNLAQENAITAAADRARAWVALIRRTGTVSEPGGPANMNEENKDGRP